MLPPKRTKLNFCNAKYCAASLLEGKNIKSRLFLLSMSAYAPERCINSTVLLADLTAQQDTIHRQCSALQKRLNSYRSDIESLFREELALLTRFQSEYAPVPIPVPLEDLTGGELPYGLSSGAEMAWADIKKHLERLKPESHEAQRDAWITSFLASAEKEVELPKASDLEAIESLLAELKSVQRDCDELRKLTQEQLEARTQDALENVSRSVPLLEKAKDQISRRKAAHDDPRQVAEAQAVLIDITLERLNVLKDATGDTQCDRAQSIADQVVKFAEEVNAVDGKLTSALQKDKQQMESFANNCERELRRCGTNAEVRYRELKGQLDDCDKKLDAEWSQLLSAAQRIEALGEQRRGIVHAAIQEKQECGDKSAFYEAVQVASSEYNQSIAGLLEKLSGQQKVMEGVRSHVAGAVDSINKCVDVTRRGYEDAILTEHLGARDAFLDYFKTVQEVFVRQEVKLHEYQAQLKRTERLIAALGPHSYDDDERKVLTEQCETLQRMLSSAQSAQLQRESEALTKLDLYSKIEKAVNSAAKPQQDTSSAPQSEPMAAEALRNSLSGRIREALTKDIGEQRELLNVLERELCSDGQPSPLSEASTAAPPSPGNASLLPAVSPARARGLASPSPTAGLTTYSPSRLRQSYAERLRSLVSQQN